MAAACRREVLTVAPGAQHNPPLQPNNPTTPAGAVRPTFSDEVISRSQQFAQDLLRLVPELEGVAIVHSYTIPQDRMPYGLVVGRLGPLRHPAELMHMAAQLHGTLRTQLDGAFEMLRAIDQHMGHQAAQLQQLQEQIDERQRQLNGLDAELAGRQATPGG